MKFSINMVKSKSKSNKKSSILFISTQTAESGTLPHGGGYVMSGVFPHCVFH